MLFEVSWKKHEIRTSLILVYGSRYEKTNVELYISTGKLCRYVCRDLKFWRTSKYTDFSDIFHIFSKKILFAIARTSTWCNRMMVSKIRSREKKGSRGFEHIMVILLCYSTRYSSTENNSNTEFHISCTSYILSEILTWINYLFTQHNRTFASQRRYECIYVFCGKRKKLSSNKPLVIRIHRHILAIFQNFFDLCESY